ncbi:MAG TPA: tyrosine-type recombinase/integrase [Gemmataceae bacterium]|nr:tyrosine-type recombinase/integrase [Gemmataceae bacterium]
MARLFKPWITRYIDPRTKKRTTKGNTYAVPVKERARKWYADGIPGQGKKKFPLATDRRVAEKMLADLIVKAERGGALMTDRGATRMPLKDHLAALQAELLLGIAGKGTHKKRPPSETQVDLVAQRVRDILDGCGFVHPGDLNAAAPAKLAKYLRGRLGKPRDGRLEKPRKESGLSEQTAVYFVKVARRFARWLSKRGAGVAADVFDSVHGFDPENNRKHARREIGPEELARLIDTTRASGRVIRDLSGPDRAMLYLVAFATGYRANELAELTPEHFDLDGDHPAAILPGRLTKNGKPARQPLQPGLAALLRAYLADRPTDQRVWPGTWSEAPVRVLKRDLAAANVPYVVVTIEGPRYADFHALRHSYVTALAAAGVGPKELQELARHGDPRLTLGIYTHARPEALGASVARLQLPGVSNDNPLSRLTRAELEERVRELEQKLAGCTCGAFGCAVVAPDVRREGGRRETA